MKKLPVIIFIALILFVCVPIILYLKLMNYGEKPIRSSAKDKIVIVSPGEGLKAVAWRLNDAGLINHPIKFKLLARLKGYDKRIKAGEYLLSASLSPNTILSMMVAGKVYLHKFTIPEGYTVRQTASLFAREGFLNESDFLKATANINFVKQKGIDADSFEGYLFPDTYYFPKQISAEKIISTMVRQFWSVFTPEWKMQCQKLGFSVHEAVTLASIIEKETGTFEERPIISSVFHNRLKKSMRLESDPTAIYQIENFDGNLTRKHLNAHHPYNTYQIGGLPPGPIANPGFESLKAALYPAETPYLYFVSKNDKTHYFSTSIEEHNRAVRKFQLGH